MCQVLTALGCNLVGYARCKAATATSGRRVVQVAKLFVLVWVDLSTIHRSKSGRMMK